MNEDDYQEMGAHTQIAGQNQKNAAEAAQYYLEEKEKGLVDIQLEVESVKSDIYHLLRQDRLVMDDDGKTSWDEIKDKTERTLSDWGVERIMQLIHFYINKNTLLTNFDEKQIRSIMLTFMKELNDLILLKYQHLFRTPSFEECKEIIKQKMEREKEIKKLSSEVLDEDYDDEETENELKSKTQDVIKKEISKIQEEKRREKIRDYGLLVAQLEVIVYATLNRAYRGEERGSIRRHTQISELIGGRPSGNQSGGGAFSWGGK